jgi:hypothetical protein
LAGRVEIEVHGVTSHAIRQRCKLRRSPQRPAHDRGDRRRALKLDDIADNVSGRQLAAREHYPDSVDECDPGALDHLGRRALEIEASNEIRNGLARCRAAGSLTLPGPLGLCLDAIRQLEKAARTERDSQC